MSADRTLAAKAYRLLRTDIVAGKLVPGSKLKLDALGSDYAIGLAPLREALSRLAGDGLVITEGQRGYWVKHLDPQELADVNRIRTMLEVEALEMSIRNGGVDWRSSVSARAEELYAVEREIIRLGEIFDQASFDRWETANRLFHSALISACDSPTFIEMRDTLYARAERYRRTVHRFEPDTHEEHHRICSAALGGQIARACRLLEDHISQRGGNVAKVMALREGSSRTTLPQTDASR